MRLPLILALWAIAGCWLDDAARPRARLATDFSWRCINANETRNLTVPPDAVAKALSARQALLALVGTRHDHVRSMVSTDRSIYWSDSTGMSRISFEENRVTHLSSEDVHQIAVNERDDVVFSDRAGDIRRLLPDGTSRPVRNAALLNTHDDGDQLLFAADIVYWTQTHLRAPNGDGDRDAIWAMRLDGSGPWRAADVDTLGGACASFDQLAWVETTGRVEHLEKPSFLSPSFRTAHFVTARADGSDRSELATIQHANAYGCVMTPDGLASIIETMDGQAVMRASHRGRAPVTLARSTKFPLDLLTVGDQEIYFVDDKTSAVESVAREDPH